LRNSELSVRWNGKPRIADKKRKTGCLRRRRTGDERRRQSGGERRRKNGRKSLRRLRRSM
jgi:hypothetical protein